MNAQELINYIANSEKKTPVKLYIKEKAPIDYGDARGFGAGDRIVFGDWASLGPIIEQNRDRIEDIVIENDRRNSGVPLLDMKAVPARIEPGAVIREQVTIGSTVPDFTGLPKRQLLPLLRVHLHQGHTVIQTHRHYVCL